MKLRDVLTCEHVFSTYMFINMSVNLLISIDWALKFDKKRAKFHILDPSKSSWIITRIYGSIPQNHSRNIPKTSSIFSEISFNIPRNL